MASTAPYDVNKEGNWIYREYQGEYGLTSPGWYRIHGQYDPYNLWWSAGNDYSTVNSVGSNSFFQLSGDFSDFEIVYAWRNILNEDGSIYYIAYGGKVASIIVKNKISIDFLIEEANKLFPVIIKAILAIIGLCIAVKLIGRVVKGV